MSQHDLPDDPDPTEIMPARPAPVLDVEGAELTPGAVVGRYRIDALLGRGGMGEVYRAEQLEPVRRTVALKLLRQKRFDARHLAYFEVERQMLAQMRHPAIAQVFDAGTTAEGFPYFVMEFIDGTPVTRYCEQHALSLRQRVELFVRICQGVQHAHQKGVIHRDLKPGNLLVDEVDGKPVPKIIDFGIATAATRGLAGDDVERAGTPEYMSPEQAGCRPRFGGYAQRCLFAGRGAVRIAGRRTPQRHARNHCLGGRHACACPPNNCRPCRSAPGRAIRADAGFERVRHAQAAAQRTGLDRAQGDAPRTRRALCLRR